jgi:hypothetical protein
MQRYSGIFMGQRKKPNSEIKAEMEGSGDDREPQGLAFLAAEFDKFHQTIYRIESTLVLLTTYSTRGSTPCAMKICIIRCKYVEDILVLLGHFMLPTQNFVNEISAPLRGLIM